MNYIISESSLQRILTIESASPRLKEKLIKLGYKLGSEVVGSIQKYVDLAFDGDIFEFSKESGINMVEFSDDKLNMYINDLLVNNLDLKMGHSTQMKNLGEFKYKSAGGNYTMSVSLIKVPGTDRGKVIGVSGDYGWGYSFITTRNTYGLRVRTQIFNQVIEKYDLQKYLRDQ
jgi:hypothetical protein